MVHGWQLVPRWNGEGLPPIAGSHQTNAGDALLERTHPFVGPLMGGMYGGPRCNHHCSVLLKLPVESIEGDMDVNNAILAIAKSITSANYYCGGYMGKDQPQMDNLFRHLSQAHSSLQMRLDSVPGGADDTAEGAVYRAKRVVYRMMNVVQRRMHKGMPEMVAYLLDDQGDFPEFICSHSFRPVFTNMLLTPWEEASAALSGDVERASRLSETVDLVLDNDDCGSGAVNIRNARIDYECRPPELRDWPFYFFQSGVAIVRRSQKCRLVFSPEHPLSSKLALRVRTQTAWKIPQLYGPAIPDAADDAAKRAILLMLLLRPWGKVTHPCNVRVVSRL